MVTLFEGSDKWEAYLKFGTRQFCKKKTVIYKQGGNADGFYYVHKGLIKIVASTVKGNDRLLNIVVPGQLSGIQAMDGQVHFTTAITAKDSVLYHFSYEQFKELISSKPEVLTLFSRTIIQKMRILIASINMNTLSTEQQIAMLLLNMCDEFRNYEVPLTQQELANCTGFSRITIYKILKQWKEKGIVTIENRKFLITRPDLLKNVNTDSSSGWAQII